MQEPKIEQKQDVLTVYLPEELFESLNDNTEVSGSILESRYLDLSVKINRSKIEEYLHLIKTISLCDEETQEVLLVAEVNDNEEVLK